MAQQQKKFDQNLMSMPARAGEFTEEEKVESSIEALKESVQELKRELDGLERENISLTYKKSTLDARITGIGRIQNSEKGTLALLPLTRSLNYEEEMLVALERMVTLQKEKVAKLIEATEISSSQEKKKKAIDAITRTMGEYQLEIDVTSCLMKLGKDVAETYAEMLKRGLVKASFSTLEEKSDPYSLMSCARPLTKKVADDLREKMYAVHMRKYNASQRDLMDKIPLQMKAVVTKMIKMLSQNTNLVSIAESKNVEITVYDSLDKQVLKTSTLDSILFGRMLTTNDIVTDEMITDVSRAQAFAIPLYDTLKKKIVFVVIDFWSVVGTRVYDLEDNLIGESLATPELESEKTSKRSIIVVSGTSFVIGFGDLGIKGICEGKGLRYRFSARLTKRSM